MAKAAAGAPMTAVVVASSALAISPAEHCARYAAARSVCWLRDLSAAGSHLAACAGGDGGISLILAGARRKTAALGPVSQVVTDVCAAARPAARFAARPQSCENTRGTRAS